MEERGTMRVLMISVRSDDETRMMGLALQAPWLELRTAHVATWEQLEQVLREHATPIIHIVGRIPGAQAVELEDADGVVRGADPDTLARYRDALAPVEVVVLDGCYSRSQARSWLGYVNAVIGIPASVAVANGARFAVELYHGIDCHVGLVGAFNRAWGFQHCELLTRENVADTIAEHTKSGAKSSTIDVGKANKGPTLQQLLLDICYGHRMSLPILVVVEPVNSQSRSPEEGRADGATLTIGNSFSKFGPAVPEDVFERSFFLVLGTSSPAGLEAPVIIGRSRRCDVCIDNESMSKVHASIVFDGASGEYQVVDENSRNGTCINGKALTPGMPSVISSGDHMSFGDALFVFLDPPTLHKMANPTE